MKIDKKSKKIIIITTISILVIVSAILVGVLVPMAIKYGGDDTIITTPVERKWVALADELKNNEKASIIFHVTQPKIANTNPDINDLSLWENVYRNFTVEYKNGWQEPIKFINMEYFNGYEPESLENKKRYIQKVKMEIVSEKDVEIMLETTVRESGKVVYFNDTLQLKSNVPYTYIADYDRAIELNDSWINIRLLKCVTINNEGTEYFNTNVPIKLENIMLMYK